jgi:TolA-binding protein
MKGLLKKSDRWAVVGLFVAAVMLAATAPLFAQDAAPSPPEAILLFNDAVQLQNNSAFKASVDEWQKFLKRYPKDPLAFKARYYLGVCLTQLGQQEEAVAELEVVLAGNKKFPMREDALLAAGTCYFSLGQGGKAENFAKAAKKFADLFAEFPQGKSADEALYFQGESLYNAEDKAGAVAAYDNVVKNFPNSKRRADALYAFGATQEELKNFAAAGTAYDAFLKEFPDHELITEIKMRKAETLMQTGDNAAAEKLFGEVAAVPGFELVDHATFRQAECLFKLGKFPDAANLFAKVATDFPQSKYLAEATMRAGQMYYRAEDFANAAPWFDKAISAGGADVVEAAHWRCRIYLKLGEPAKAAELAGATLPKAVGSPFLPDLMMDQADGLYEQPAERAKSLPLYLKIYEGYPEHESAPQALYNAAFTALDLGDFDGALTHANTFIEKFPQHRFLLDAMYVAAESLLGLTKYSESEQLYLELISKAAGRPELEAWQLRLGVVLYLQEKRKEVVDTLTPLLPNFKNADHTAEGQFLVGTSQFFLGQYDAAVTALEASLAANPKWTQADEAWLNLSRAQGKLKKLDAAIASVKHVLEDFPKAKVLDRAHYRLGEYSYTSGDFATAISEYGTVLTDYPNSQFAPYALSGKGWAELRSKMYAEGAKSFTSLIEAHPNHQLIAGAVKARATCRYHTGDFEGAITDINTYLESKPGVDARVDALYVRGLSESEAKKYIEAVTSYETILADKPGFEKADRVMYELGWANKSGGKSDEAAAAFTRLTTEHPDSPLAAEAFYHVGESQYGEKKFAEAAGSYAAARDKAGKGDLGEKSTYKLGWAYYQQKKFDEALEAFSSQVTTYPEGKLYTDGLFMQGECLFKLERHEEALAVLAKCQELAGYSDAIRTLVLLHGGQSASQLKQWAQAVEMLAKIPEAFPKSRYLPEALYEQGWAKQNLDEKDAAKELYAKAAEADLARTTVGARARFMLGELHFGEEKHQDAINEFQRVVFTYGGAVAPAETKKWQAKSAYEVGRCNEVLAKEAKTPQQKQQFIKEAIRFYKIVVEKYPDSDEAAGAKTNLERLQKP